MKMRNHTPVNEFLLIGIPHTEGLENVLFVLFMGFYLLTLLGNLLILLLAWADTSLAQMVSFTNVGVVALMCFLLILTSYTHIFIFILKISSSEGRRRAFSTCSAHLTSILLFYGPVVLIYLWPVSSLWLDTVVQVSNNIVTPSLNPLIYTLRNKDVKLALRK
ncbi:olfactory receptor 958-like, partial [Trichechus manatus latirostris]|uniref:Olfactory receptor 958-like n=1 Tax=Trichechus manatus latirostris TaxID=127582 RepID=A0A2Y9QJL6_TRIMA